MSGGNFVDLRITHAGTGSSNEDSVWPAFTDIMTVVVMIFLMVLLAFLIKNAQLVDELQNTLIAKDEATQQALLSESQNSSLENQLAMVRQRILTMEATLGETNEKKSALQIELKTQAQLAQDLGLEVSLLTKLRDELTSENTQLLGSLSLADKKLLDFTEQSVANKNVLNEKISILLAEKAGLLVDVEKGVQTIEEKEADRLRLTSRIISLSEQLRSLKNRLVEEGEKNAALVTEATDKNLLLQGLETSKAQLQLKLDQMLADLSELQQLYDNRGDTVLALEQGVASASTRYKSLQQEYDSLDSQYRKLIRPARSTAGKVVVEVIYSLKNGEEAFELKLPGEAVASPYAFADMHAGLVELKQAHGQKLYTKVRIADDSGVSFNNAWKFTQDILSKYDYYAKDYAEGSSGDEQ